MIRYNPLFATSEFQIGRFDHPRQDQHCDPAEEVALDYSVNRLEYGEFALEIEGQCWELTAGDIFLTYPGMTYRCRHREPVPTDVCTTIACLASDVSEDISVFERTARRSPVRPPSNRLAYLFIWAGKTAHEPMAAEEAAHEALALAVCEPSSGRKPYREHQLRWYAERVDAIRRQIDRGYTAEQRLSSLARAVGMSPFHFARVFRELTRVPPHLYLCRTRLQNAARSLREGASVTEACFTCGFQNLSHFSRQFHRHFGVKPSTHAANCAELRLHRVQK